jgi:tRNA(adenine34) deaminase
MTAETNHNHEIFMEYALKEARKSLLAGEFPVGCVIVCKDEVIAAGSRIHSFGITVRETDHAEILALRQLEESENRVDRQSLRIYSTLEPCLMCMGAILISGIHQIIYAYEDVMGGAASCNLSNLPPLYSNKPISIIPHILREKSLSLFHNYFSDPSHDYWKDSILSRYTLDLIL